MYYFIKSQDVLIPCLVRKIQKNIENYQNLEGTVVTRMPDKNVDILDKLEFHPYKKYIRKQMIPETTKQYEAIHKAETADMDDLNDIYQLLYGTFDIMTDHLVSKAELCTLIEVCQVLKIAIDGELAGVLLFETFGKKSYLRSICVSDKFVGKKIGLSLLYTYILKNLETTKLFYLWVESTNKRAIQLYEKLGYKDTAVILETFKQYSKIDLLFSVFEHAKHHNGQTVRKRQADKQRTQSTDKRNSGKSTSNNRINKCSNSCHRPLSSKCLTRLSTQFRILF